MWEACELVEFTRFGVFYEFFIWSELKELIEDFQRDAGLWTEFKLFFLSTYWLLGYLIYLLLT
jgi:surface polysaccharide O-acyltransferase-like enzyme